MAWAMTPLDWGMRNVQPSWPAGNTAGEKLRCGVLASAATPAMGMATGVATEPMMMSAFSSVTKRLAFFTPLVGSVASSSTMTLSFSPAMLVGHSLTWLLTGMPRPEAGPVSGRLTPMVISARAAPDSSSVAAAVIAVFFNVMKCLLWWVGVDGRELRLARCFRCTAL